MLISSFHVTGKSAEEHNIDIELRQCLEEHATTAGMRNCTITARQQWDSELNKYYKLLMENLSAEGQGVLREAQREWLRYRNKEFVFINALYFEEKEGTMWHPTADAEMLEIVKRRGLRLRNFYEELEQ